MELLDNPRGGYRFLTGIAAFSSGVIAAPGHQVVHVTLRRPAPWRQGFALIERHLAAQGRPRQALCAVALRSPKPFTFESFAAFNTDYRALLAEWACLVGDHNPVARTNVAPVLAAPGEESLYSFAYTADGEAPVPTFVVAGAGDIAAGPRGTEAIVRYGETSPEAMAEKARHVMGAMADRLAGLGVGWADVTHANMYTVHEIRACLPEVILAPMAAAAIHGVRWHYARPPIEGLEFEMDLRGVAEERVIAP
jgi:hypothetical protein